LNNHASILALLLHYERSAIRICQDQQILLNRQCPIEISGIDTRRRPAIQIAARAYDQFRQPIKRPFVPSEILTHLFTVYNPSVFGVVMMILL